MNLQIIIQARITSTRLPKKILLPVCGMTILEIMIKRLDRFKKNIIIATTNDGTQYPIVDICKRLHVKYFEGDVQNVLSRYYYSALHFNAQENTIIVRCTSDCPLIDSIVVKQTIEFYKKQNAEYVCACSASGFPRGMDTEVFSFALLKDAFINAESQYDKEHVTPYIQKHTVTGTFKNGEDHSKYRLTLDEIDDYKAIIQIYKRFDCKFDFNYKQLITVLKKYPDIYEINKHVEQKKYTN